MNLQSFIKKAPKAELHSHIDGGLRVDTILEYAKKYKVELPTYNYSALEEILVNDDACVSLVDYFNAFNYTLSVLQTPDALEQSMFEFLEDAHKDHIKYMEARFSPALHLKRGLSLKQVMDAILKGKEQAERVHAIKSKVIVCGLRTFSEITNMELAQLAVDYKNKGVVAFDLAGEEFGHAAKDHQKAFQIAINNNLCRTVHAGEADGPHSIAQAIHYLGAQRIGHGTSLIQDKELMQYFVDRQIPLEVCLSSNTQTKSVNSFQEHPFRQYFDKKIPVTINTDSTLISGTSLSDEYMIAAKYFNFDRKEITSIMRNAFEHSFLPFDEKQDLLKEVDKEWNTFV
ncbi:MAG: adenosine deaminase [Bacteroidetes bacterium 4572_77]|nr:MAG: adenosine deaminase [Bacteroidetes bacterium 4572_77]